MLQSMVVVFALIGDLVGSRPVDLEVRRRRPASRRLCARRARWSRPLDRLEPTVGDEFQGCTPTSVRRRLASLLVRLNLPAPMDARCGIGVGEREVFGADRTPMLQDGEAWWGARAALEALGEPPGRSRHTAYDDRYAVGAGGTGPRW